MATSRQVLGRKGEIAVRDHVPCPRCGRARHLVPLAINFQCADLICKFCGFLAQVKATTSVEGTLPKVILGAAWRPQHEQILAGIFQPLYVVVFNPKARLTSIHYIPAHILQSVPTVFEPRNPLSETAKRAGWTGFNYNLSKLPAIGIEQVFMVTKVAAGSMARTKDKPVSKTNVSQMAKSKTLHEAMAEVLRARGNQPITAAALAQAVNESGLYARGDGRPVPPGQVSARRSVYKHLFAKTASGIQLVNEDDG